VALVNYVARWDGQRWYPLGDGLDSYGNSIDVEGSDVYVGGVFDYAGGVPANGVAKWDGSGWSALGSGLDASVLAIKASGNVVYAGGGPAFLSAWDGTQWSDVGGGVSGGSVRAIAINAPDVYVGGSITAVGETPTQGIAKWNGSAWELLGSGLEGTVYAIATSGTDVYAVQTIVSVFGTVVESWVKKWDGVEWTTVGTNITNGSSTFQDNLQSLTFFNGTLTTGGTTGVWQLFGGYWFRLLTSSGTPSFPALSSYQNNLYIGGSFFGATSSPHARNIVKVNGSTLSPVTETGNYGFNGRVAAIAVAGANVYAGGGFTAIGAVDANRIGRWDGTQWKPMGPGFTGPVFAVAVRGGEVFAGGEFISRWNGSQWLSMGGVSGGVGEVRSIASWNNDVYAAGHFTSLGGVTVSGIGRWDGSTWHPLGTGLAGDRGSGFVIATGPDALYVGGRFITAGGVVANRIARWDGTSWSSLGTGLDAHPFAIAVDGDKVYAAGIFNTAGGLAANNVAMWDGGAWQALGSGLSSSAFACALKDGQLYVGGGFSSAGSQTVNRVAKWDGTQWQPLGSGARGGSPVFAMAASDDNLYIGGDFTMAGDKASVYFGKWLLESPVPVLVQRFDASTHDDGVHLSWQVSHDGELESFRLYRAEGDDGALVVLDEQIPVSAKSYVDGNVKPATRYRYVLAAVNRDGTETLSQSQSLTTAAIAFAIHPNVPNPFNPATSIRFSVPDRARVIVRVHDVTGALVVELLDEDVDAGYRSVEWNGRNSSGATVASGPYFVYVRAGKQSLTQKIMLLK
jgi:hypothetical protein